MNILKIGGKVLETSVCFRISKASYVVGSYFSASYYVERAEGFKYNNVHCMSVWSKTFRDVWW